jgi:hypothetical protein
VDGGGTVAVIRGLDHQGSGDFTQDVVDLKTKTSIADISVTLDSTNYLKHKKFDSELSLKWNMKTRDIVKGRYSDAGLQLSVTSSSCIMAELTSMSGLPRCQSRSFWKR